MEEVTKTHDELKEEFEVVKKKKSKNIKVKILKEFTYKKKEYVPGIITMNENLAKSILSVGLGLPA